MKTGETLKITPQRKIILEELRKAEDHPTADELYERVRRRLPRVSLGTVYRNLDHLSRAGMINRIDNAGGQRRYDGDLDDHLHVRCIECGAIDDVPAVDVDISPGTVESRTDFRILGHRLEFIGMCPPCSAKMSESADS